MSAIHILKIKVSTLVAKKSTKVLASIFLSLSLLAFLVTGPFGGAQQMLGAKSIEEAILQFEPQFSDVRNIEPAQWQRISQDVTQGDFVLVDVRTQEERAVSVIPRSISYSEYQANRSQYKNHQVVVYCTIGYRSALVARQLCQQGENAVNLRGGILRWIQLGGSLKDQAGEQIKEVHTYGQAWNFVPTDYVATW
ncbi:rhodanese-like domain-containing protein [Adhaeretor mobilis]|uniref:Molybdopterin biosynthesis protein MoeB n=1 Tax=Adhaeretor mobilis TaxID=1930276 RepID=A0A517MR77_9BACT|nr:rhodanese-like domain-containing protein [Adhaeretor mobilis]QDS97369.1 molybdopterin biosynthesis protein MoeB [Adhaeretor mobilis]